MVTQASLSARPPKSRKKRRLLKVFLAILAVLVFLHLPIGQEDLCVSRETTAVTGPLRADGTVDYVAAFNAECSQCVTPENNAAPLLLRAIGSGMISSGGTLTGKPTGVTPDERYLTPLGLQPQDLDGNETFVAWPDWLENHRRTSAPAQGDSNSATAPEADSPTALETLNNLWAGQKHPQIAAWLEHNAEAMELLAQAATKPRYYLPLVSNGVFGRFYDAEVEVMTPLGQVAYAFQMRAELRALGGDFEGAWQDMMTIHRLARLIAQKELVVPQLVSGGLDNAAGSSGVRLVTRYRVPPALAVRMAKDLESLGPVGSIHRGIRGERIGFLDLVTDVYRGAVTKTGKRDIFFSHLVRSAGNPNLILKRCNWWWDQIDLAWQKPSVKERIDAFAAVTQQAKQCGTGWRIVGTIGLYIGGWPVRGHFSRELADNTVIPLFLPALSGGISLSAVCDMQCKVEVLSIALARYHADHTRWPAKLDELVPRYVESVPLDIFTGKPLIYSAHAEGYLLYSVGQNLRDDGGRGGRKETDDIVARVPTDANEPSTRPKP